MDTIILSVSCNHKVEKYRREALYVEARVDRQGPGQPDRYYVSMKDFGCSKSYATPEEAVFGMLESHACFDIRVKRMNRNFKVNHIESEHLADLRKFNERLFENASDRQRDMANWLRVWTDKIEHFEVADILLLRDIQSALGTGETGEALVEVARNAHAAERARAGDTYNGWPNYETWLAYTWITDNQAVYTKATAEAKAAESVYVAGDLLKEQLPEWLDFPVTGLAADYVNAGMSRVDWMQIAESLRAE